MSLYFVFVSALFFCNLSVAFSGDYGGSVSNGDNSGKSINAAVISKHVLKIKNVPSSSQQEQIPTIIIGSSKKTLKIKMPSTSSDVQFSQEHHNASPQTSNSNMVDSKIVLNHFVWKPILQNVREIIIPQRKITIEMLPVKDFIKTIVPQESSKSYGFQGTDQNTRFDYSD